MARVFVHHDKTGKVLAVAQVDELPGGMDHPFHLQSETDTVVELDPDDPAHAGALEDILDRQFDTKPDEPKTPARTSSPGAGSRKKR